MAEIRSTPGTAAMPKSPGANPGSRKVVPVEASDAEIDAAVRILRDPATIRTRCHAIAAAVAAGHSPHFTIDRTQLLPVAERVAKLTRVRFPDLQIPVHSRWRHFEAGGVDRKERLDALLEGRNVEEVARSRIELTLISVLLDAGAGPQWRFIEYPSVAQRYSRSEGLAVASFRAFTNGRFSSDPDDPCRVDAKALMAIDAAALAAMFQASTGNPLVGLDGRVALLRRLGEALHDQPQLFGLDGRPGMMFDALVAKAAAAERTLQAGDILALLLDAFSAIWPSGQQFLGRAVGDVWPHPDAGGDGASADFVPFHKLSQWLTYSLLEPFAWAGIDVDGLDALTGLPEYRNGGLLIDAGLLVPTRPRRMLKPMTPADPWIIEWRALTVAMLDEIAPLVRETLGVTAAALPLACILEGGTWAAGRAIAAELRKTGAPPVTVDSDGTVF
ncbi:MAG: URC4/urg3 family protein [Burkholderiaceae bacterium]